MLKQWMALDRSKVLGEGTQMQRKTKLNQIKTSPEMLDTRSFSAHHIGSISAARVSFVIRFFLKLEALILYDTY